MILATYGMSKNLIHPPSALCALYPGITIVTIADRANLIGRAKKILPRVSAGYLKARPIRAGPLKSPGFRAKIRAGPRLDPALGGIYLPDNNLQSGGGLYCCKTYQARYSDNMLIL